MSIVKKIYFATNNKHKAAELQAILSNHTIIIPAEENIAFEPEETGSTFLENAIIKANELYNILKAPVIADDSGLCIDALEGRPGIFSARYGCEYGVELNAKEKNALILQEMKNVENRAAHFSCAMVLRISENRFFAVQETLEGEIARLGSGNGGFGYDPIFYLSQRKCCLADLDTNTKNTISHRGKAAKTIGKFLQYN